MNWPRGGWRRQDGCSASRMQRDFHDGLLEADYCCLTSTPCWHWPGQITNFAEAWWPGSIAKDYGLGLALHASSLLGC